MSVSGLILFGLVILSIMRARRITRSETRALRELSRTSSLTYHHANLLRGSRLIGKWKGRAAALRLGIDGLTITIRVKPVEKCQALIRFPASRTSPTWGISREFESTYHMTGDLPFLRRLAGAAKSIDEIRNLSGEFQLRFLMDPALTRRRRGRVIFHTSIAIAAPEQLRWILDSLSELAGFAESEAKAVD